MNLGERVKKLRKDQGWSQQDFANRTSISRARVAQLETDPSAEVKAAGLVSIAKAFGCTIEQLLSNNALESRGGLKLNPITRKAPVVSWNSLPAIIEGKFMLESEHWVGCPYDLSENSFALEVQDEVMTASNGRSYPLGVLIFVDPNKTPVNGDRIVAIDTENLSSVFREYVITGGIEHLKPLNDRYPIKEFSSSTRIIGTVVGSDQSEG